MLNFIIVCICLVVYLTALWNAGPRFMARNAGKVVVLGACLLALFYAAVDDMHAGRRGPVKGIEIVASYENYKQ